MVKDKTTCLDCYNNRFSKGMKEIYSKEVNCIHCKKLVGYRKPTKKEKDKNGTRI